MRIKIVVFSTLLSLYYLGYAQASTYWSMNASSCTPLDTAMQGNKYFDTGGTVKHKSTVTGTITLYCPVIVNKNGTNPTLISFLYQDSVADANNNVTVALWRMSNSTGGITQIATQSSSFFGTGTHEISESFTHTMDFVSNTYFVRVDIKRNSTTNTEIFYRVLLQS